MSWQLVKEILEKHNLYQENEVDNEDVEEAEVHDLDTGNRIQVDIAMQAADEEKVDEPKKTEKTSKPLQGSGASGMSALMEELKEDIQGMKLYRWLWECIVRGYRWMYSHGLK